MKKEHFSYEFYPNTEAKIGGQSNTISSILEKSPSICPEQTCLLLNTDTPNSTL